MDQEATTRGPVYVPQAQAQALRLAGIYLAVGILWILFSDYVTNLAPRIGLSPSGIQTAKGVLYVLVTALIGYGYLWSLLRRINEAQQDLLREHQIVLRIAEASPIGITVADPGGRITYANAQAERVLGLVKGEIASRAYDAPEWEITDYDGAPFPESALPFNQVRGRRETVRDIRHAIGWPDGQRVYLSINAAPLLEASGAFGGMVATVEDVTAAVLAERERANLEAALRKSEAQFEDLYENAPDMYASVDAATGKILRCNETLARVTGFAKDEIAGRPVFERYHLESLKAAKRAFQSFVIAGEVHDAELRLVTKDGGALDVSLNVSAVRDAQGKILYSRSVWRDITARKQAEVALRHEQSFSDSVLDSLPGVLYCYDEARRFVRWNKNFERVTGYTGAEISGMSPLDFFTRPEKDLLAARIQEVFDKGASDVEADFVAKDGTRTPYYFTGLTVAIDGRRHLLGVGIDVSARKRAEEALREREEQLRLFVEYSPAAIAMFDTDMKYLVASRCWLRDYGIGAREIIGRSHYEVFPDLPERWKELHRRSLAGTVERCEEDPFPRADGHTDWVRWEMHPWRRSDGGIGGIIIFSEVVTERKKAEAALRASEERLRLALDAARMGTFDWDTVHDRIAWSHWHEMLLGLQPGEFDGTYAAFTQRVHPDDLPGVNAAVERCMADREPYAQEFRVVWPDGSVHWIAGTGEFSFAETGQASRMLGTVVDITGRKRAEEEARVHQQQLMQADKMASLGVLVSGVAHEINNPNTFVATNSVVLRDVWTEIQPILQRYYEENGEFVVAGWNYLQLRDRVPTLLSGLADGAGRITRIVQELREFARHEPDAVIERVRLNDVVESAVMLMRNMLGRATSRFEERLAVGLPLIGGSRQRLEQVLINLLQNACQALTSPEQGIAVSTAHDAAAGVIILMVSDEGKGVAEHDLGRLTDPFFTTRGESGGTGLGLAICATIVREHGGQMSFASTLGKGVTVTVTLPVAETDE